jgi:hypothetical protein
MHVPLNVRSNTASARQAVAILGLAFAAALLPWLAAVALPPLAQPQEYHDFADQRLMLGVPHALNVLSNLPFLLVGVLGLRAFHRRMLSNTVSRAARVPWLVMFIGVALTAFGSAYYHLDPTDATLVWDRLPMALGFAGLVAGTLADRAPRFAGPVLAALGATGVGSVAYWAASANLMPYLMVQLGFVAVALLVTALVRSPYTRSGWLYGAVALYAAAIVSERLDRVIDAALGGFVSGHTLKHLFAAAGIYVLYRMLLRRRASG